jgi:hypothetical protein
LRQDTSKVSEDLYLIRAAGEALAHEEDFVECGGDALLELWGELGCWERIFAKLEGESAAVLCDEEWAGSSQCCFAFK